MAMAMRTNCWQRQAMMDRGLNRHRMIVVGLALVVYRQQHGELPETLAALAPQILPEVPVDPHSQLPYTYARTADGARLVSWGVNRVDDAGQNYNDDQFLEIR